MELNELFAAANAIGRKYQDASEIAAHEQAVYEADMEFSEAAKVAESKSPFVRAMELCHEPEIEAMSIGDRTEFDLRVANMQIPDAGKGRFGNLISFLED